MTSAETTAFAPAPRLRRAAVGVLGAAVLAVAGCGDDGSARADPARSPTGVRWQQYQGVALPVTEQGPAHEEDGAATGFDHGPAGAAVAAVNHAVRLAVAPDNQWSAVLAKGVVPGPARDDWAVDRVQLSITGPAAREYAPRVLGYRITEYTQDRTTVDVFTQYSDGSRAVNHTTVEWFGQDWRLRLPEPGATARPVDAIDQLPGDIVILEAPT
ncbi:hypothetical protein NDR87_12840 [Nocardia sp. CDC159]|uniref:DUF8175 domain-containing protein n=1 Tax=Nocardia pulmonis TaxID=2951408 RepID=A0A9X2EAB3_9NOCA|nr:MULTISPECIES: hypothetical protein [Nocardia]MCM6774691.1 hypothetical protein [Nocardia pulmonis]MCM6787244.1 hypothetical protein [Nocardia sp. CDC159]